MAEASCDQTFVFEDSQSATFKFNDHEYGVTNVSLNVDGDFGDDTEQQDITTLAIGAGCCRIKVDPILRDCGDITSDGQLTVNFFGQKKTGDGETGITTPPTDAEYDLVFEKFGISQKAVCTNYTLDASVGEYVTGTATFDLKTPIA